ncbi:hypothetical protein ABZX51_006109 [Aspergillus tubingensis]|uniref:DUF7580 domain-containing protein n=1 Tax=Aspergillus tubingensis (strain CBS 134.48) TaxID=767770 RepID=A0A1L9N149_ASPTC|nr:hypothetical protein ASPTUDRAFT_44349 [Aspergillus tubingensis CBS 134.48]
MVSGVEAVGLALALLPLVVNQLDSYAHGIEQIKRLSRYQRTLEDFALQLGTQHRIFQNSLQHVLDEVVDDDNQLRDLISDPDGDGWKEPLLEKGLMAKLGRDHAYFFANVVSLHDMLKRMAVKLDVDVTRGPQNTPPSKLQIVLFLKVLSKALYEDMLQRIRNLNDVLRTLLDQSSQLEASRQKRSPWRRLLPRFRETRKNAEGLFRAIVGSPYWSCRCQSSHRAHLQLQSNPFAETPKVGKTGTYRITFSNSDNGSKNSWTCREVEFEPYTFDQPLAPVTNHALPTHRSNQQKPQKPKVRFETVEVDFYESKEKSCNVPPIADFCTVLCRGRAHTQRPTQAVGFITDQVSSNVRYNMHFIKCYPEPIQLQTLQQALPNSSRRHRLYIAAGLACGVLQYHGNWLKKYWDSSDIQLPADDDNKADATDDVLPSDLYLPWSLNAQHSPSAPTDIKYTQQSPLVRNQVLFPLGIALTELSLGKSITSLRRPQDEQGNEDSTRFITAFRVLNRVQQESGSNYRDAVHNCLCWLDVDSPCLEDEKFQGRVFNAVVAPLLRDLAHFEGVGVL